MDIDEWVTVSNSDGSVLTVAKDAVAGGYASIRSLAKSWPFAPIGYILLWILGAASISLTVAGVTLSVTEITPIQGGVILWLLATIYDYLKNPETDVR